MTLLTSHMTFLTPPPDSTVLVYYFVKKEQKLLHHCRETDVLKFQPVIIGFSCSKLKKGRRHVVYYLFVRRTSLRACLYHVGGVLKTNRTVVHC